MVKLRACPQPSRRLTPPEFGSVAAGLAPENACAQPEAVASDRLLLFVAWLELLVQAPGPCHDGDASRPGKMANGLPIRARNLIRAADWQSQCGGRVAG